MDDEGGELKPETAGATASDSAEDPKTAPAADTAKKPAPKRRPSGSGVITTRDPVMGRRIRQRQVRTSAPYEVARRAGIAGLVKRFGLTAAQFADNVRDQYLRHEVDQCPMLP